MSILSDLMKGKITWATAKSEIETWGAQTIKSLANDPNVVSATGAVVSDLKQAASDAISTAETLAGPVIIAGADSLEAVADTAFKAYFGPFAPIASKATHDGVDRIANGLIALLQAKAAAYKASMAPAMIAGPTGFAQQLAQNTPPQPLAGGAPAAPLGVG